MKLTKCPNNHYYNADKLPYCPHCINLKVGVPVSQLDGMDQKSIATASTEHIVEGNNTLHRKTIGWLVCIQGNMLGESFILYDIDNYIGRSPNMNICLSKEPTVSRENHACITFDQESKSLTIIPGNVHNKVLLNDTELDSTRPLSDRNLIQLGDCILLFVALCNEMFSW